MELGLIVSSTTGVTPDSCAEADGKKITPSWDSKMMTYAGKSDNSNRNIIIVENKYEEVMIILRISTHRSYLKKPYNSLNLSPYYSTFIKSYLERQQSLILDTCCICLHIILYLEQTSPDGYNTFFAKKIFDYHTFIFIYLYSIKPSIGAFTVSKSYNVHLRLAYIEKYGDL